MVLRETNPESEKWNWHYTHPLLTLGERKAAEGKINHEQPITY